jgi:heat shock protein HslJ
MMKSLAKINLLLILVLLLAACAPVAAPVDTPTEAPTAVPAPTEAAAVEQPTAAPIAPAAMITGPALAGTNWVLTSLNGSPALEGATVTLQFGADGVASGSDGCNRYSTAFTEDGASLIFAQPMASTMMMCPEPAGVMEQASAFAAALAATTNFSANQSQLALLAGNQILATLTADVQALAGTDWDVIMYNNGREAVVGVIEGTELTVLFGADGDLSGSAGCNQYIGSYTVDGNTIQIGQLGSTMRFCAEPEGTMEQEQAFLAALQSAATFRIEGNQLEMRTAADAIAVMMTRRVAVDLPEPPPEPATPTGRVVGTQGLNVRTGPGTNFPVIGVARLGDEGEIVGRSADGFWWAVAVPAAPNGVGWVSANFVAATNAENVPVIAAPPPPPPTPTRVPPPPTPTRPPAPPTATPAPAQPTATPAAEIAFWADRTNITQGGCATLNWSVQNVQAVWVYPVGAQYNAFPRTGQGNEVVCPATTTTYEMRVRLRDGTTQFRQVTITVNPVAPTATPMPPVNPLPPVDALAGTRWNVVNYNNGSAIVTLVPGTSITMNFGVDGQVTGNSGCNSFAAGYTVNGSALSITRPSGTQRFCESPAGVMEQEASFQTILPTAASFRINGSQLEIQNAAGQIVVVATRAP